MTIENIEFPGGLTIDESFLSRKGIKHLLYFYREMAQELRPGEHDITPAEIPDKSFLYNVIVNEDGTASFRVIPETVDHAVAFINVSDDKANIRTGGRIMRLPEDGLVGVIAHVSPTTEGVTIYGLVFHKESVDSEQSI